MTTLVGAGSSAAGGGVGGGGGSAAGGGSNGADVASNLASVHQHDCPLNVVVTKMWNIARNRDRLCWISRGRDKMLTSCFFLGVFGVE